MPTNYDLNISRPSGTTGQNTTSPQFFPRTRASLYDTFYINTPQSRLQGGRRHHLRVTTTPSCISSSTARSQFNTDTPFNVNDPRT